MVYKAKLIRQVDVFSRKFSVPDLQTRGLTRHEVINDRELTQVETKIRSFASLRCKQWTLRSTARPRRFMWLLDEQIDAYALYLHLLC